MPRSQLRERSPDGHQPVGFAELFFDLVYVFAVTQLSHYLLEHHDIVGLAQGLVLFLAIWWAWTFMTWATNWLDPESGAVRLVIFLVMFASLVMGASLPKAFGDAGLTFAIAYLAMQLGRTPYIVWLTRKTRPELSRNLLRATIWFAFSAPFWIAGALADPETRLLLWAVAVAIEYAAPALLFRVPGMGASKTQDFEVSGGHMAERCGLLIIVALGEGILLTGATFAKMEWDAASIAAFVTAFTGSVLMWWIYFDLGAKRGVEHIEHHGDAGNVARGAYTYCHIPIVGGIILTAVSDEMVLAHPVGHLDPLFIWTAVGGAAMFLAGVMQFKKMTSGRPWFPLSHLVGLGALAVLAAWGHFFHPQPLWLGMAVVVVLAVVAIWEWGSFHGGWQERGLPVPSMLQARADQRMAEAERKEG